MSKRRTTSALALRPGVLIPCSDLRFEFSRSPKPGGQNVNKVNTRVTLRFDIGGCASLTEAQRARIRERLSTRVTTADVLFVTASRHRTQAANRRAATERFVELVAEALKPRKPRTTTRVPAAARARRLEEKKRRSQLKRMRCKPME
ncbi:MAG: alternative ribosome rescue aminoacyl-tRNA hydrolase ArfB [Phycisphaerae bacterium]